MNTYTVRIVTELDASGVKAGSAEIDSSISSATRRALADIKKIDEAFSRLSPSAQRAMAKLAAAQAQQSTVAERVKDRASRAWERAETSKLRATEASSRAQTKAAEQATRASEAAKNREFRTHERVEREKFKVAERTAKEIERANHKAASSSSSTFSTFLGASFFSNLGARAVSALFSELQRIPEEATKLAVETQNALKGLESVATFKGIDKQSATDAVQNLRFVKGGIISVAEASIALKNLLLSGYGLPESITLLERFSDAAAFGKQAALSYGEAITHTSEGIKNQNSLLSDSAGITKNLSVILKERGFEMEDLSSKTKGASARLALYNGLLIESQAQVGDADKVMAGFTGTIAAQDLAYQNLERAIGKIIIQSPASIEASKILAEQFREQTAEINNSDSAVNDFAEDAVAAWNKIKANAIPAAATIANLVRAVSSSMGLIVTAAVGSILRLLEEVANAFLGVGNTLINGVKLIVNGIVGAIQGAGGFAQQLILTTIYCGLGSQPAQYEVAVLNRWAKPRVAFSIINYAPFMHDSSMFHA
jgi:hypothetical protein